MVMFVYLPTFVQYLFSIVQFFMFAERFEMMDEFHVSSDELFGTLFVF